MAHSFNRVGNAPRFVFQISNFKYNNRGPLGTRLNEPMPTACGIVTARLWFMSSLARPIRVRFVSIRGKTPPAAQVRSETPRMCGMTVIRSMDFLTLFSIGF